MSKGAPAGRRKAATSRRTVLHAFRPSSGHPHLCEICNAEKDEQRKSGAFIHHP